MFCNKTSVWKGGGGKKKEFISCLIVTKVKNKQNIKTKPNPEKIDVRRFWKGVTHSPNIQPHARWHGAELEGSAKPHVHRTRKKNRQEISDGFVKFLEDLKQIGDREKDYSLWMTKKLRFWEIK